MTHTEAVEFVSQEIRTRYRTMNDTQFADWVDAVQRLDQNTAHRIVHDLVQDPGTSLSVKAFNAVCAKGRMRRPNTPIPVPLSYSAWVVCLEPPPDHPDWQGREWSMSVHLDSSRRNEPEFVRQHAAAEATRIHNTHGGDWAGLVKQHPPAKPLPPADPAEVRKHIINGPDSDARTWLIAHPAGPTAANRLGVFHQVEREPGQEG